MERVPRGFQTASRRRTWSMHGHAAIWSNTIQVFYDKNWCCDHFGGFV